MPNESIDKIYQIIKQFHLLKNNAQIGGDLSRSEFFMLKLLRISDTSDGLSISKLSELLKISKPAVSQMVNSLENKGFVERVMPKSDRRMVLVHLTEQGLINLEKEMQVYLRALSQTFDELGEQDTEELLRLLTRLHDILVRQFPGSHS